MLTCPRSSLSFHSNAHHHGSLPQQLGMVWDLLLKADPEGPSPIFHAALRHSFHTPTVTPQHVSLQHTLVKNPSTLVIGVTDWLLRADNYARARGIPSSDKPRAEPTTSSPCPYRKPKPKQLTDARESVDSPIDERSLQ